MKAVKLIQGGGLIFIFAWTIFAQQEQPQKRERVIKESAPEVVQTDAKAAENSPATESKQENVTANPAASPTPPTDENNLRKESESEEEAAIIPYYNNYLKEYRLGPEDIISVEVFGQCPNYCKEAITVPPTGKISYPLINQGVFVAGKTVEQVAAEITKRLDEYIIEPNVTVTLEKVGSARFSVLGKVGAPGVRLMNRRYNIYEAITEAGGVAKDGDKKRILLIRNNAQGGFTKTVIDFDSLLNGKTEIPYLAPGDQVIVPEKKWSLTKVMDIMGKASAFRILFGVPF